MDSRFLQGLGIGNWDYGIVVFVLAILLVIALVLIIVQMVRFQKLKKRYEKFSQGRNAKSLEEEIGTMFEQNKTIKEQTDKNRRDIKVLYKSLESAFQKIGLVRYDAFAQMGGKLSFALCLLDEKNNGFLINSVQNAEGCYTYSKEIIGGVCDIALSEEEQKALSKAMSES